MTWRIVQHGFLKRDVQPRIINRRKLLPTADQGKLDILQHVWMLASDLFPASTPQIARLHRLRPQLRLPLANLPLQPLLQPLLAGHRAILLAIRLANPATFSLTNSSPRGKDEQRRFHMLACERRLKGGAPPVEDSGR